MSSHERCSIITWLYINLCITWTLSHQKDHYFEYSIMVDIFSARLMIPKILMPAFQMFLISKLSEYYWEHKVNALKQNNNVFLMKRTLYVAKIWNKRFPLLQIAFHATLCRGTYGSHCSEICKVGRRRIKKPALCMCHVQCKAMERRGWKIKCSHEITLGIQGSFVGLKCCKCFHIFK